MKLRGESFHIILIFALNILPGEIKAQDNPCLSYEPSIVKLVGVVKRQTFPGPPNYESIKGGDELERFWMLRLSQPICVQADSTDEINCEAESHLKILQMVFGERKYSDFPDVVNKRVQVTGTLFHSHTAHHRTRVLINIQNIVLTK